MPIILQKTPIISQKCQLSRRNANYFAENTDYFAENRNHSIGPRSINFSVRQSWSSSSSGDGSDAGRSTPSPEWRPGPSWCRRTGGSSLRIAEPSWPASRSVGKDETTELSGTRKLSQALNIVSKTVYVLNRPILLKIVSKNAYQPHSAENCV
jgi:hypothetical protein